MRNEMEEIHFRYLEAKGGIVITVKPKSKKEIYDEELKEVDRRLTRSLISKALKKI
jgi:hypothetical protein